jgi:hypothetical protein
MQNYIFSSANLLVLCQDNLANVSKNIRALSFLLDFVQNQVLQTVS